MSFELFVADPFHKIEKTSNRVVGHLTTLNCVYYGEKDASYWVCCQDEWEFTEHFAEQSLGNCVSSFLFKDISIVQEAVFMHFS